MKDVIGTTVLEELYGNQYMEMAYTPHDMAINRNRGLWGYSNPDDPRVKIRNKGDFYLITGYAYGNF